MNETSSGAEAPKDTAVKERQIGPETRAVRIFREVFAQDAQASNHLKPSLDRYLKLVLDDPDAKRADKTYARKIFADLLRQFGHQEPPTPQTVYAPETVYKGTADELAFRIGEVYQRGGTPSQHALEMLKAKREEEALNLLSDQDIQEILSAPPPDPIAEAVAAAAKDPDFSIVTRGMDVDPLDGLLDSEPVNPIEQQCQQYLDELMVSNELPFVRVFTSVQPQLEGLCGDGPLPGTHRYVALGTVLGTVTHGKHEGKRVNIHCTIAGFRRLRDAEEQHAVYLKGKALVVSGDDPKTGLRKYIFCLKHTPGLKIRYWTRINDKDEHDRAKFFVLTGDGVRVIGREQF